jgi:hypothetical protein
MKRAEVFPDDMSIKGDSPEVMKAYYNAKILQLLKELNQLNILDHPVQIQHICQRIRKMKDKLYSLDNKKSRGY